jgi:hypothetical protein
MNHQELECRAHLYAQAHWCDINFTKSLGHGEAGCVWRTERTAIKVFERERNYSVELQVYQRLSRKGITELFGLAVPRLFDHDDDLQIIEIGLVEPPFILDFEKCHLDAPPDFSPDVWAEIHQRIREDFGENAGKVNGAIWALKKLGIYYVDPKIGNILFPGQNDA